MPYRYLDGIATADVAFEAWGATLEEMIVAAGDATVNAMVSDLSTIHERTVRVLEAADEAVDFLLFQTLQELIFYKDAESLLLRIKKVSIDKDPDGYRLTAEAAGEAIDPTRHELVVDVKAVTLYRFEVKETEKGWRATVILDV